jgi:hypothetical protein
MKKITLSLAAAALATGIASAASAATPAATGLTLEPPKTVQTDIPGTRQAGYFYRYRCYYVRYGYRLYRRCYVRYYHY